MKTTTQREQRDNRVADERSQQFLSPGVNIYETKDGYVLEAEMPGVNREGLEIMLEGSEITLVGRRHLEPVSGMPLFRESHVADFRRVFELDPAIDTARISARMDQGVLTLTLPKSERVKPRKISVD